MASTIYRTVGLVTPWTVHDGDYRDAATRSFSLGMFGFSLVSDGDRMPFVWEQPTSEADRVAGGICAVTGYWAPGHCMVKTPLGNCISNFAPNRKQGRYPSP